MALLISPRYTSCFLYLPKGHQILAVKVSKLCPPTSLTRFPALTVGGTPTSFAADLSFSVLAVRCELDRQAD